MQEQQKMVLFMYRLRDAFKHTQKTTIQFSLMSLRVCDLYTHADRLQRKNEIAKNFIPDP